MNRLKAFTPLGAGAQSPDSGKLLHPYYGAEISHDTGGVLEYFRELAPDDDTIEIVILGGSAAAAWAIGAEVALKEQLEPMPEFAGRDVQLLSFAHAAYKQPQQLNRLAYLFGLGARPEIVINLDGFNDLANGYQNGRSGIHPTYPAAPVWASILWARNTLDDDLYEDMLELQLLKRAARDIFDSADRLRLWKSKLLSLWVRSRIERLGAERSTLGKHLQDRARARDVTNPKNESRVREERGAPFVKEDAAIIELSANMWQQCSTSIHSMCSVRGIYYLHAMQPSLADAGSKPMTQRETAALEAGGRHWKVGVTLGYAAARARFDAIQDAGVHFLDLTGLFRDETRDIFVDPVHFNRIGSNAISAAVSERIRRDLAGAPLGR